MGSINKKSDVIHLTTHEGARAKHISNEMQLRRTVLSCLLWEREFYEDGKSIADRLMRTASLCSKQFVYDMAMEARHVHGLRHVPLMLLISLINRWNNPQDKFYQESNITSLKDMICNVIRRPDEMTELLALYWRDGKKPLSKQLQRGLAKAFCKFDEYSLAKYDRDGPVKLRDVMFLSHAKPTTPQQEGLFKRVANRNLIVPMTWEVRLSALGADPKKVFTKMLENTLDSEYKDRNNTLGYLALLRNLRNMVQAGVDSGLIKKAIALKRGSELILPFRYVAAARACPQMDSALDTALQSAIKLQMPLKGRTGVLVDVSGSMDMRLSQKSDLTRLDAAAALASVINAEDLRVFSFSYQTVEVPARRGLAGIDAIVRSQPHGGTQLGAAVRQMNTMGFDRLIVITDEQSRDRVPDPTAPLSYMINVASYRNGIGYGKWLHLDGFSESIIKFIHAFEELES